MAPRFAYTGICNAVSATAWTCFEAIGMDPPTTTAELREA